MRIETHKHTPSSSVYDLPMCGVWEEGCHAAGTLVFYDERYGSVT